MNHTLLYQGPVSTHRVKLHSFRSWNNKMVVLVFLMLSMIFLPACSAAATNNDTSLSEASIISDTDQDASFDTDNVSTGGACSYYDSEMVFSTYAELEAYVLKGNILPENGKLFEVVSPYDGSEASYITLHGNWVYFEFNYSEQGDSLLSIGYNYNGNGEKGLQAYVKNNEGFVLPFEKAEGVYYSVGGSNYVLDWTYNDFYFTASVPEEILDTAVENIVAGKYIR